MSTFILETFKPEVFWTALAAIGTLLAVLIALYLPTYNESKRVRKIVRLVEGEMCRNYQIAKNATSEHTISLPNGSPLQVVQSDQETARLLNLDLWKEYKYKLADDSPESYEKYQRIYQHIDAISNLDLVDENRRPAMVRSEISSFIEKCREELRSV